MARNTLAAPEKQNQVQEPNAVALNLGRTADQNSLRNIGLVVAYEYKKRLTQRSFIISNLHLHSHLSPYLPLRCADVWSEARSG